MQCLQKEKSPVRATCSLCAILRQRNQVLLTDCCEEWNLRWGNIVLLFAAAFAFFDSGASTLCNIFHAATVSGELIAQLFFTTISAHLFLQFKKVLVSDSCIRETDFVNSTLFKKVCKLSSSSNILVHVFCKQVHLYIFQKENRPYKAVWCSRCGLCRTRVVVRQHIFHARFL